MPNLLAALVVIAASSGTAALTFDAPAGWTAKPPSSSMRVAEFTLARAAGDPEDAAVTVFFFGGQGGGVDANLERWIGQMSQPDGRPSKDAAVTTRLESHGLKITLLDLSGTFIAQVSPASAERFNKPGFRMKKAVVETPGGPYFVELVGPKATVAKWNASFDAFLKSLKFTPPGSSPCAASCSR